MCLAIPGKVISINTPIGMFIEGKVSFGGIRKEVELSMVPEVKVGDYVLVHVGVALTVIDEKEALISIKYIQELDELNSTENNQ